MKPGDVVVYKETHELMAVAKVFDDDSVNNIECSWWNGKRFLRARFCQEELECTSLFPLE
jgi:uncharacterized protein YodC (DUF2158 family)